MPNFVAKSTSMAKIIIRNFGPLKNIELTLRPINVFMGPQSCGKSTIAKVISFCLWLEKNVVFRQSITHIQREFFDESLIAYHGFAKYCNEGWSISYSSDVISFDISADEFRISLEKGFEAAELSKNAYIPSERNIVSVPGISSLKLPDSFLRSFIFDWLEIQTKFSEKQAVELFDLGAKFYYDVERGRGVTRLTENDKELEMSEVSSGLQSVIPLLTCLTYLTRWIYEHNEDLSYNRRDIYKLSLLRVLYSNLKISDETIRNIMTGNCPKDLKESTDHILEMIATADSSMPMPEQLKSAVSLRNRIARPHYSNIVIEEPEQNLFPRTQIALLHRILAMIGHDRDRLVITTHSPFILYALNNCLLGYLVKDEASEIADLNADAASWVDPSKVAVYEIADGVLKGTDSDNPTIQDKRGLIRKNYFDQAMAGVMGNFSTLLGMLD